MQKPEIDWKRADILIRLALEEDLGDLGDTTTNSVIPADLKTTAVLIAKDQFRLEFGLMAVYYGAIAAADTAAPVNV